LAVLVILEELDGGAQGVLRGVTSAVVVRVLEGPEEFGQERTQWAVVPQVALVLAVPASLLTNGTALLDMSNVVADAASSGVLASGGWMTKFVAKAALDNGKVLNFNWWVRVCFDRYARFTYGTSRHSLFDVLLVLLGESLPLCIVFTAMLLAADRVVGCGSALFFRVEVSSGDGIND
jgi:hypothetical protein